MPKRLEGSPESEPQEYDLDLTTPSDKAFKADLINKSDEELQEMVARLDKLIKERRQEDDEAKPGDFKGMDDHEIYNQHHEKLRLPIKERLLVKSELETRRKKRGL